MGDDILCQEQLNRIAKSPRVNVWYTVDRVPEGMQWPYSVGFINEEMLRKHMQSPDKTTMIFMCGPPPMLDRACKPNLDKIGHGRAMCTVSRDAIFPRRWPLHCRRRCCKAVPLPPFAIVHSCHPQPVFSLPARPNLG